jgi:hypothetical protein
LEVQWRPPAFDGGSFVMNYRLEIRALQHSEQVKLLRLPVPRKLMKAMAFYSFAATSG